MSIAYVIVASITALFNYYAAYLDFTHDASVVAVAERVRVSTRMMVPFGILLAAGATGLVVGFAVPALGTAAAIGLVLYFVCALSAHVRVGDRGIRDALMFLTLAVATLVLGLAA
ncbi:hypothetical protein DSM104299_04031 [Baekduia alba]|uniref:DoxX family protein n=1 Tax=Baekduia alba TaxID=2997333 RepID=UPI002341013C|nr:DoxX family protein [Baekduia alba]WCB95288.1 hypothetical protein DSM104299_04031 [Baekduia alba]